MHALPPRSSCMCGLVERARHKEKGSLPGTLFPAQMRSPCTCSSVDERNTFALYHACRVQFCGVAQYTIRLRFLAQICMLQTLFLQKGCWSSDYREARIGGADSHGIFSSRHARGEPGVARIVRPCGTTCLFSYLTPVRGHKNGRHLRCSSRFLQMRGFQRRFQRIVALH